MRKIFLVLALSSVFMPTLAWAQAAVTNYGAGWGPNPTANANNPYTVTTGSGNFSFPNSSSNPAPAVAYFCNIGTNPAYVVMGNSTATASNTLIAAGFCKAMALNNNISFSAIATGGSTTLNIETGNGNPQGYATDAVGGGATVTANQGTANTAANAWPVIASPSTLSAISLSPVVSSTAEASHVISAAPANLYSAYAVNLTATAGFLVGINATSAPGDGAITPIDCVPLPPNGLASITSNSGPPSRYSTGIVLVVTSASTCFTKTTGVITAFLNGRFQ